jgi:pyruvate/2-oxoglutarate dehydrogenase complex dihydrolipoamide dehydrogenase (E3) component
MRRFCSRVTIIERNARLAHREDQDVADTLQDIFREEGIESATGTSTTNVEGKSGESGGRFLRRVFSRLANNSFRDVASSGREITQR